MMKLPVLTVLVLFLPALVVAQYKKPNPRAIQQNYQPQQQQQQQQQSQQQFTNRFNPDDNKNEDQQSSFNSQQQQPRFNNKNNNNNNFNQEPRRESTTFIPIIRFDNEQTVDGGYKTLWETGNNILAEETGILKAFNDKDNAEAVVQQGSYMYTSPEGQQITVQYTADENGFRASGDHLPTPPPIPADIQKSLDLIYAGIRQQQQQGEQRSNNNQQQYNDQQQYNSNNNQQYNSNNNQQYNSNNNQQQYDNNQQQTSQNRRQDNINFRPTGNNKNNRGFRQ